VPPLRNSLLEVPAGFSVTPDDYWNSAFTAQLYNGYAIPFAPPVMMTFSFSCRSIA